MSPDQQTTFRLENLKSKERMPPFRRDDNGPLHTRFSSTSFKASALESVHTFVAIIRLYKCEKVGRPRICITMPHSSSAILLARLKLCGSTVVQVALDNVFIFSRHHRTYPSSHGVRVNPIYLSPPFAFVCHQDFPYLNLNAWLHRKGSPLNSDLQSEAGRS